MNIGIDISQVVYGSGVSDYTESLVRELLTLPGDNKFCLFAGSLRRRHDIHTRFPQAKVFPVGPSLLDLLWNRLHLLPVEAFLGHLDIWHSSDWTQGPSRAPAVTTIHDLSPFIYPQELDPRIVSVHNAKMRWVIKECRRIICVSEHTASDLMQLFSISPDRIAVIPEALPLRFQSPTPAPSRYSDYLVTIGSAQPRKNIARLISAYLKYKHQLRLPSKLVIIGQSQQSSPNPSIIFTGYISDTQLINTVAGAEALVYPSLYEGFGLPPLIAFHCGVPVACTNSSSLPEVVGPAGILFDPLDEKAIARAVVVAIRSRTALVRLGKTQLSKFSWQRAAAATLQVYTSLV